ncbi:MAG: competence/damage-inducible protein A [Cytophagales bacterium]|nr:competence/damage-inducible protein A [Armatimonadota bacterium]
MIAEVVSIGTELLLGQIVDTDAAYLAQQLSSLGINVYHRATVGDNLARAIETLRQATERADLVITVAGLGPTMDDLTRDAIAEVMDAPLVRDPAIAQHLSDWFAQRGYPMSETILRQADVPTGAVALPNANGTAPGLLLEKNGTVVIALPGPPNELIPLFETSVYPYLLERTAGERQVIRSKTLRIVGMGESTVEEKARDLMEASNPSVAPYAKTGEVHLRVTARASSAAEADRLIAPVAADLRQRLGGVLYGEDDTTLEKAVVALLMAQKKTVATAESCTGGMLSGRITDVPGASAVFHTGLTTYSNDAKIHLLKIPASLVGSFGAVSSEVAKAMAERVRELAEADYGVSVTGIAGPDGGSDEKPVGLVYIGLATAEGVTATQHRFNGLRSDIRLRSTQAALDLLRKELLKA